MANRLSKRVDISYQAAVPYQPAVAGYCVLIPYEVPGYQHVDITYDVFGNLVTIPGPYTPPRTVYVEQCFPDIPAQQAVPAKITYSVPQGWNAGARSISQLDADGYVMFKVSDPVIAVAVGFSAADTTPLPSEQTHAFYIHGTQVQVMEKGAVVATASVSHAAANVYRIERHGVFVTYSVGGWSYTSSVQSGGPVVLDASLYAASDYVDTPMMAALTAPVGTGTGTLLALQGSGYDNSTYSDGVGSMRVMSGVGAGYTPNIGGGSAKALKGTGAEIAGYSWGEGSMPAFTGDGDAGYPLFTTAEGVAAIPLMVGVGLGLVGAVGTGSGSMKHMVGFGADAHGYAEGTGTFGVMYGYGDQGWPVPGEVYETDVLLMADYFIAVSTPIGTAMSELGLGDYYTDTVLIDGTIYDALLLSDNVSATRALTAMIMDGLELGTDLSNINFDDVTSPRIVGSMPIQYAVNPLTGALTTYSNFGFSSFANVGGLTYGAKKDGVYLLRPGDDNGSPITIEIDLGSSNFGTPLAKVIESVSMAVTTDAQVYIKLRADDGDELVYRLDDRGSMMRTLTARGVSGRRWHLSVQMIDANHMELEQIEQRVAVSTRRWSR